LHASPAASSFAGSQASAIFCAARFIGMLGKSPRDGVIIRHRQSSEMIATQ